MLSRVAHNSAVHTELNAMGKKSSKTLEPRCSERVTNFFSLLYKLKSGAACPICNAIYNLLREMNNQGCQRLCFSKCEKQIFVVGYFHQLPLSPVPLNLQPSRRFTLFLNFLKQPYEYRPKSKWKRPRQWPIR